MVRDSVCWTGQHRSSSQGASYRPACDWRALRGVTADRVPKRFGSVSCYLPKLALGIRAPHSGREHLRKFVVDGCSV